MPKGVYDRRNLTRCCRNCGRALPDNGLQFQKSRRIFCRSCKLARQRKQQAEYTARTRGRRDGDHGTWTDAQYVTSGSATQRQLADATLDKGGTKRHCPDCGGWYVMENFTTPCPHCGDHLIPLPGGPYVES